MQIEVFVGRDGAASPPFPAHQALTGQNVNHHTHPHTASAGGTWPPSSQTSEDAGEGECKRPLLARRQSLAVSVTPRFTP